MIFDVAFPGLDPWQEILGNPAFWHVRFHQTDLPEKLVSARQAEYFRYFLTKFSDTDVAHYEHAYRDPDHLRAAFETYRSFPTNEKFFVALRDRTEVPIVIGSGEDDAFAPFLSHIAAAMRAHGCVNLKMVKAKIRQLVGDESFWKYSSHKLVNPERYYILEKRGRDRKEISGLRDAEFFARFWDARVFAPPSWRRKQRERRKGQRAPEALARKRLRKQRSWLLRKERNVASRTWTRLLHVRCRTSRRCAN
jgi:hypothetical protein